ncbi:MAG: hypothetical protein KC449_28845, partial [Anaerolineales bacterium]|nr:hypothetical protein [Anaerolineales bacterium]
MKRKQITLLFLFIVGIAILFTRRWWLPWILARFVVIEERSGLLEGLSAIVGFATLAGNGIVAYFLWLTRTKRPDGGSQQTKPIEPITTAKLREELGAWGGSVAWVNRGDTRAQDLNIHQRMAIVGRMKLGKTREAIELIDRAIARDIILPTCIYRPTNELWQASSAQINSFVQQSVAVNQPVLLFVDDLPAHFKETSLEQLTELIKCLTQTGRSFYLLATIRTDQWELAHRQWLEKQNVHLLYLTDLNEEETFSLVENGLQTFSVQAGAEAQEAFVAGGDGTPERILSVMRELNAQDIRRVDAETVQEELQVSLLDTWASIRTLIQQRDPASGILLNGLAAFYMANIPAYKGLTEAFAADIWG